MRGRGKKKAVSLILAVCFLLAGCGNTKIVLTTGLASDELFRIGEVSCRLPEALVYLMNQKGTYESVYGIDMWEHAMGEETMEEYLKSQVLSELAQVKSMVLLAGEEEILLSEAEISQSEEAASEYFATLSQEEAAILKVDQEALAGMYQDYCLAFKTYRQITEDVSIEISDDEARIIQLQQMFVPEEGLAGELKRRLEEGEDFGSLAANYSQLSQTTVSVARGDKGGMYEEVAFDLNNDEVSDVFAEDGGYYILKCISTLNREETDMNKIRIVEERRKEAFSKEYDSYVQSLTRHMNEELWQEITLLHDSEITTSSFFEVLGEYYKK